MVVAGAVSLLLAVAGLALAVYRQRRKIRSLASELKYCQEKYASFGGFDVQRGNWRLQTLDGGKTWYWVKYDFKSRTVKVLGEATPAEMEELRAQRAGMQALIDHVEQHGPIRLGDPNGRNKLREAGFTVEKQPD